MSLNRMRHTKWRRKSWEEKKYKRIASSSIFERSEAVGEEVMEAAFGNERRVEVNE